MFAERLKLLRKERKITQIKFAQDFNISKGTIGMWETGKREPDFEMVIRIADYFGVSSDYLLGRDDFLSKKNNIITVLNQRQMTFEELSEITEIPIKRIKEFATLKKTAGMKDCLDAISEKLSVNPAYLIGMGPYPDEGAYGELYPTDKEWADSEYDPYKAYDLHQAMEFEKEEMQKKEPAPEGGDGLNGLETSIEEQRLDEQLIQRLCLLTLEELGKVDAFVQGMIASR